MSQVKDKVLRAWRRLKGAASDALAAIAAPKRGAHSAGSDEGDASPAQDAGFTRGAHSVTTGADKEATTVTRGAHSVRAAEDDAPSKDVCARSTESVRPAHGDRVTRSRSTRGAHTTPRRRVQFAVSARGAHSTSRAPRATIPCNLQTAPAAARGYSMAEVLATVGIILILASIVVVNVVSFQANLRQKELDAKAEVIYTAAQEQMTRIMASGRDGLFASPATFDNVGTPSSNEGGATSSPAADPSAAASTAVTSKYGVSVTPALPLDVPRDQNGEPTIEEGRICYITSDQLFPDPNSTIPTATSALFGNGGLEDDLLNKHWVIEYDYKTLTVYSVFYSESFDCADADASNSYTAMFDDSYNSTLRSLSGRLESASSLGSGCYVGYHGGGSSGSDIAFTLSPEVNITNAEKLVATVRCSKPLISEDLGFLVILSDDYGNRRSMFFAPATFKTSKVSIGNATVYRTQELPTDGTPCNTGVEGVTYEKDGSLYTLTMVLDSLESTSTRFNAVYGGASAGSAQTLADEVRLVTGSNIHLDVKVLCDNGLVEAKSAGQETFSSLFANDTSDNKIEDGVAGIAYGRHLQNLGESSGVFSKVTSAVQYTNVNFSSTAADNSGYSAWLTTYADGYYHGKDASGAPRFEPIVSSTLGTYNGAGSSGAGPASPHSIIRLNVHEDSSAAGLFGTVSGDLAISNLALTGTTVIGAGDVGGVVGAHNSGKLEFNNVQLYLSTSTDTPGKTYEHKWLQGDTVGGLVGTSKGGSSENPGTLVILNSSASTVAGGSTAAGGLVGSVSGARVSITNSYADCYLTAQSTGGLVGSGNVETVSNCYSAGYLGGSEDGFIAAGLVNGKVTGSFASSYTVCAKLEDRTVASWLTTAASGSATPSRVYYHSVAVDSNVLQNLGNTSPFDDSKGDTGLYTNLGGTATAFTVNQKTPSQPYNLKGQSLTSYSWPSIADVYHYGDWEEGFQPGTLVYFEEYLIGSSEEPVFGFAGANVTSTLKSLGKDTAGKITVVGDGYGVVYASGGLAESQSVEVVVTNPSTGAEVGRQTIEHGSYSIPTVNGYVICPLGCGRTQDHEGNEASDSVNISNTPEVNGSTYYLRAQLGNDYYYFNPHFAKTVHAAGVDEAPTPPSERDYIYIRTARQLYNLSLHYDKYRGVTQGHTFYQERNIAYTEYKWKAYTAKSRVRAQAPIGADKVHSFNAIYNGARHEITDVSFVATSGLFAGMFGYVADNKDAKLENIVLCTDYVPAQGESNSAAEADLKKNFYVQHTGGTQANETLHMGVLAGYNGGTIENCATAGYFLAGEDGTVHAYANSRTHLGGMVGTNAGTVRSCASDAPKLRLSLFQATTKAGGFVGSNDGGTIADCYALGAIDVVYSEGGTAAIAGFAGSNAGRISDCYCATAVTLSGDTTESYGFAPVGGVVRSCSYLNGGTYSYVKRMYAYSFDTSSFHTSGTPASYSDMVVLSGQSGYVRAADTEMHSQTQSDSGRFPYRGVVTGINGRLVHYGNWQDDVKLGTMGVFYWEHEQGGGNEGYHLTYLGNYEDTTTGTGEIVGQSSLCNSHNDGGVITEYGYGFYVQQGQQGNASVKWSDITCSGAETGVPKSAEEIINEGNYNEAASLELDRQMKSIGITSSSAEEGEADQKTITEFLFCAFTTSSSTEGKDYIRIEENVARGGAASIQNGAMEISFKPTGETTTTYSFTISPFFANAMSIDSIIEGDNPKTIAKAEVEAADDRVTDHYSGKGATHAVGMEDNPYEVRSLQQLQYINWNAVENNTSTLITGNENYRQFPYLMYTTFHSVGTTSLDSLEQEVQRRASFQWLQTHDVAQTDESQVNTPIAAISTSTSKESYKNTMYTWFGSGYDGQSYTIKNIVIKSDSFNVGLFGTTVGANLKNIIMSCDTEIEWAPIVERATGTDTRGSYSIGGLVGVAYDYNLESSTNTIENCAISGYTIKDSSADKLGLGEANIGGLIGVANVNLKRCEAVTNIVLDQRYQEGGTANFGIYTRVGGVTGATQGTLSDCYSGGSCEIKKDSWVTSVSVFNGVSNNDNKYKQQKVFIGGIAGSGFTSNYTNFSNTSNVIDGSPTVKNCYTYFEFPEDNGFTTNQDASTVPRRQLVEYAIAGLADRATEGSATSAKLTIDNCYYPSSLDAAGIAAYYPNGTMQYVNRVKTTRCSSKSLSDMSADSFTALLNDNRVDSSGDPAPWKKVDIIDYAGADIAGKFSFPADSALQGKDYPYPAVIQQNDLTFGTYNNPKYVHVHYGDWPIQGSYWTKGRVSMDIFSDMGEHGDWANTDSKTAYEVFTLVIDRKSNDASGLNVLSTGNYLYCDTGTLFTKSSSIAQVVGVRLESKDDAAQTETYSVLVKALDAGATKIRLGTLENQVASATFTLEVTANWVIEAVGHENTAYDSDNSTLWLENDPTLWAVIDLSSRALDPAEGGSGPKTYTDGTAWSFSSDNDNALSYPKEGEPTNPLRVARTGSGTVALAVTASYDYNTHIFQQKLFITVEEPVPVGLSNAVRNEDEALGTFARYNEVEVGSSDKAGEYKSLGNSAPSYISDKRNVFLYTPSGSVFLKNSSNIKDVAIEETDSIMRTASYSRLTENSFATDDDKYVLIFDDKTSTQNGRTFLAGALYYKQDEPTSDLKVTVTLLGGYTVEVVVPQDRVLPYAAHTLTLQAGARSKDYGIPENGASSVPRYNKAFFSTAASDYALDGWYYIPDAGDPVRILDAEGAVVGAYSGISNGTRLDMTADVTLRARWAHEQTVWVQEEGVLVAGRNYIIVNKTKQDDEANYLVAETNESAGTGKNEKKLQLRQFAFKNELIEVAGGYYRTFIENSQGVVEDGSVWTAQEYNRSSNNSTYFALWNNSYNSLLAENDNKFLFDNKTLWGLTALDSENALVGNLKNRATMYLSADNDSVLRCVQAGYVRFYTEDTSSYVIACSNTGDSRQQDRDSFLFKQVTSQYTFSAPADLASGASAGPYSARASVMVNRIASLDLFATVNPARAPELKARRRRR